ncbi:DUF1931 family protein [Streptomyces sp. NPDC051896]|uniref:DUF1931 family protein n=1 Tax=Streptomyces sp. NPDC051896 TaxID=3155416 RepID=UPI00341EDAB6
MTVMSIARFERFFRAAAGLGVDKNDLKRYSDFVDATAKANGRDIIRTCDLPITKGLQESIHHFQKIDQEVELKPILELPATHPALDRAPDEETEVAYPDIIGGLSLALAQSFKILHPDLKYLQTQLLPRLPQRPAGSPQALVHVQGAAESGRLAGIRTIPDRLVSSAVPMPGRSATASSSTQADRPTTRMSESSDCGGSISRGSSKAWTGTCPSGPVSGCWKNWSEQPSWHHLWNCPWS